MWIIWELVERFVFIPENYDIVLSFLPCSCIFNFTTMHFYFIFGSKGASLRTSHLSATQSTNDLFFQLCSIILFNLFYLNIWLYIGWWLGLVIQCFPVPISLVLLPFSPLPVSKASIFLLLSLTLSSISPPFLDTVVCTIVNEGILWISPYLHPTPSYFPEW